MNRIDRLTAILIQLQTKKVVKAEEIAQRFDLSLRTVYRDVKALMEAGVPIGSEAGKGYFIVDGYHLPPVMFSRDEASAMMMAGKLVEKQTDETVRTAFDSALLKIKSVLNESEKDHLENLQQHIQVFGPSSHVPSSSGKFLTEIQQAVVEKKVLEIEYFSNYQSEHTLREVEPIGIFYYSHAWHLIGWCRLRNGMRDFRTDRIEQLRLTAACVEPRSISTLKEYFNSIRQNNEEMQTVVALFNKREAAYVVNARHYFGFISEEELDGQVRMTFMNSQPYTMARWLLSYGRGVEVESPEELKLSMVKIVEELAEQYLGETQLRP
jgi:predicted DNA-binding transcriptional regulator YafY